MISVLLSDTTVSSILNLIRSSQVVHAHVKGRRAANYLPARGLSWDASVCSTSGVLSHELASRRVLGIATTVGSLNLAPTISRSFRRHAGMKWPNP